ncbi:hypothetical protein ECZC04_55510 [Escherichia coli]|nr:hypothetical protein ECZC04_55510 [Escherichia coli]
MTEGFSVIVVLSNERDEKGQWAAYDAVHDVRRELWKALLGWMPDPQGVRLFMPVAPCWI